MSVQKINKVAQLASMSVKKPSKNQAMIFLETLVSMNDFDDVSLDLLAELYNFFMPARCGKLKNDNEWVNLAMGKKDVRHYLNFGNALNGEYRATDGSRLHVLKRCDMDDGFYNNRGVMLTDDLGRFPDVSRVIPKHKNREPLSNIKPVVEKHNPPKGRPYFIVRFTLGGSERLFNKQYWDDATTGFSAEDNVYYGEVFESILINNENRLAVLMPVKPLNRC